MIIDIPDENSIIKWKYKDTDEWKIAEISDLIKAYERPKGEWVYEYDDFYRCSICGRSICTEFDKLSLKEYYPFCHCGADMRGDTK